MTQKQKIIIWVGSASILILLGFSIFGNQGFVTYLRQKSILNNLQEKNQALIQKNEEYAEILDRLTSDPSYIESLSREKYGLVRSDEIIVRPPAIHVQSEEE